MDYENLTKIGFTPNEAKVYLTLIEMEETTTGPLCDKVKIPSSNIYRILESLIEKGLVNYKILNNSKVFRPNPPESLRLLFHEKKEELEKMELEINSTIDRLKQIPKKKDSSSDYKYFEGISGIKSMWVEADSLMPNDSQVDIYTSSTENFEILTQFYLEEHHKIRVKKNISERMILPLDGLKEAELREKVGGNISIKYLDKTNEAEFAVFDKFILFQHTSGENPRGFLIHDEIFSNTFKDLFEKLWKISKSE